MAEKSTGLPTSHVYDVDDVPPGAPVPIDLPRTRKGDAAKVHKLLDIPHGPIGLSQICPSGQQVPLINLEGDSTVAQVVNVTLIPDIFNNVGGARTALIDFGVAGTGTVTPQLLLVSFGRGCSFSLPCSYLRVTGRYTGGPGLPGQAKLAAFASYLPLGTPIAPTFSTGGIIAAGGATTVPVPPFGARAVVYRAPDGDTMRVRMLTGLFATIGDVDLIANQQMDPLNLPDDCKFVRVQNTGAALFTFRIVFDLNV